MLFPILGHVWIVHIFHHDPNTVYNLGYIEHLLGERGKRDAAVLDNYAPDIYSYALHKQMLTG